MNLFTVFIKTTAEEVIDKLYQEMKREMAGFLHNTTSGVQLSCQINKDSASIQCTAILPGFKLDQSVNGVYEQAGRGIAQFIINEWELNMIRDLLVKEYDYREKEELNKLEKYCSQLLNDTDEETSNHGIIRRKLRIAEEFKKYLQENTLINIEGFIRFRLRDYIEELRELVDYAIDEFLMDKQYQEFISLLKYFVYIQEAKIPVAHLMHKGENDFIIFNGQMKPIDTKHAESVVLEMVDKDINYEDMIVSTLITVSPKHIYIHTRTAEAQVVKTIQQIFEGRVNICTHCKICKSLLGEEIHPEHLSVDKLST